MQRSVWSPPPPPVPAAVGSSAAEVPGQMYQSLSDEQLLRGHRPPPPPTMRKALDISPMASGTKTKIAFIVIAVLVGVGGLVALLVLSWTGKIGGGSKSGGAQQRGDLNSKQGESQLPLTVKEGRYMVGSSSYGTDRDKALSLFASQHPDKPPPTIKQWPLESSTGKPHAKMALVALPQSARFAMFEPPPRPPLRQDAKPAKQPAAPRKTTRRKTLRKISRTPRPEPEPEPEHEHGKLRSRTGAGPEPDPSPSTSTSRSPSETKTQLLGPRPPPPRRPRPVAAPREVEARVVVPRRSARRCCPTTTPTRGGGPGGGAASPLRNRCRSIAVRSNPGCRPSRSR